RDALRDLDRGRGPDDRADGHERGGVRVPRRAGALARLPVRADELQRRRPHRRVRPVAVPRRPLPPRHRAQPPRPRRRPPRVRAARRAAPVNVAAAEGALPGALLLSEIREQPAVLERLLGRTGEIEAVASEAIRRGTSIVRMVGHGSSDNAASFGVYAFGMLPGWTALRDSISLSVYYGAEVDLRSSSVIALSQSGRTPDVVEYVARARR